MSETRILIVGESAFKFHTHFKGFASYETAHYAPSLDEFIDRFDDTPIRIDFIGNLEAATRFPHSVEELARYDAVVFSDVSADTLLLSPKTLAGELQPNRLRVLGEYVSNGGGFAMVGGWMSFGGFQGRARYAYSPLASWLPVEVSAIDDRMETPEGVTPEPTGTNHPILRGLSQEWPDFLGYNRVGARGEVLLRFPASNDPLLVVGNHGKGRVACFTSDMLPHWGSPRFQVWPGYVAFWKQFFCWIAAKDAG